MALLSLLFDRPQRVKINAPDGVNSEREILIVDASENISHQHAAEPTDNPVEEGADITDHVDTRPKVVTFDGIVSEAPISIEAAIFGNVAGAIGDIVPPVAGALTGTIAAAGISTLGGLLLNQNGNRVQDAFNALQEIQEKKVPVTIVTGLRAYSNMILQDFNPIERSSTGASLVFTATFREVIIVKSEQVPLPERVLDPTAAASASSVLNQGKKAASEAGPSLAFRALNNLGAI